MDWPVLVSLIGPTITTVAVGLSTFILNRKIEQYKAQQSKELLEAQNAFALGATSHMAAVVFDKHIMFCEAYVRETSKALNALIQEGRAEEALDARRFSRIRQKWALWLTQEMESRLDEFELRIALMGGPAQVFDSNGAPVSNERSIKSVIVSLRDTLRTEELTALRNELVMRSSRNPSNLA
jgi:hypothetical protein